MNCARILKLKTKPSVQKSKLNLYPYYYIPFPNNILIIFSYFSIFIKISVSMENKCFWWKYPDYLKIPQHLSHFYWMVQRPACLFEKGGAMWAPPVDGLKVRTFAVSNLVGMNKDVERDHILVGPTNFQFQIFYRCLPLVVGKVPNFYLNRKSKLIGLNSPNFWPEKTLGPPGAFFILIFWPKMFIQIDPWKTIGFL